MSILSDILSDLASLFFPPRCAVCGEPLVRGERCVCTLCRATAPLTGYWREADNPVLRKCWGLVPVERASGFLFFVHGSGWRRLIHSFKYRGAWRTAREMGVWYGRCLRESGLYDGIDVVVPLPLHPFKRCRRGYNQSEYLAEGIAAELGGSGGPAQRAAAPEHREPGPQEPPRAGRQCRGGLCRAPARTARRPPHPVGR